MKEEYKQALSICDKYLSFCDSDLQCCSGTLDALVRELKPLNLVETESLKNVPGKRLLNNVSLKSVIEKYEVLLYTRNKI
ncbi:hypothetical protein CMO90_03455 [Candidatus Woesearchaeota archaeon]|jgi:hypothetical protein|nr:hypothetical protein [Candidatus Woesearchaeota archaeon]|tara:strand:+ start:234 stop:473 length:240 start_codon:yes stop_codon:yes gene_type:complete